MPMNRFPYRFALWGIVGGLIFLFIFSRRIGMSFWLIPLFFAIYLIIVLVLTRMRAEQGFPVHAMENMPNHHILVDSFGTRMLGTNNLVALTLYRWFNQELHKQPDAAPVRRLQTLGTFWDRTAAVVLRAIRCLRVRCCDGIWGYPLSLSTPTVL